MRRALAALALAVALPLPTLVAGPAHAQVVVRPGETLSEIAARHGVSLTRLMQANGISNADLVVIGQSLVIPGAPGRASGGRSTARGGRVTVQPGETLSEIAAREGVGLTALMQANRISDPDLVMVGEQLELPGGARRSGASRPSTPTAPYTVKSGETLSDIATRFGTTSDRLIQINGISNPDLVLAGSRLQIPGKPGSSTAPSRTAASAKAHVVSSGESLGSIADRYGTSVERLVALNAIEDPDLVQAGTRLKLVGSPPAKPKASASQAPAARKAASAPTPARTPEPTITPKPASTPQPTTPSAAAATTPAAAEGPTPTATPAAAEAPAKPKVETATPVEHASETETASPVTIAAATPAPQTSRETAVTETTAPAATAKGATSRTTTYRTTTARTATARATTTRTAAASTATTREVTARAAKSPADNPVTQPKPSANANANATVAGPTNQAAQPDPEPAPSRLSRATRAVSPTASGTTTAAVARSTGSSRYGQAPTSRVSASRVTTASRTTLDPAPSSSSSQSTSSSKDSDGNHDWRSYGPLQVDWANWQPMGGSYVAPSLNSEGDPLYLAINCSARKVNATGQSGQWKTWDDPQRDYEQKLVTDLCKSKGS